MLAIFSSQIDNPGMLATGQFAQRFGGTESVSASVACDTVHVWYQETARPSLTCEVGRKTWAPA